MKTIIALVAIIAVLLILIFKKQLTDEHLLPIGRAGCPEPEQCKKLAAYECEANPKYLWECPSTCFTCGLSDKEKNEIKKFNMNIKKDYINCTKKDCDDPTVKLYCRKTCK